MKRYLLALSLLVVCLLLAASVAATPAGHSGGQVQYFPVVAREAALGAPTEATTPWPTPTTPTETVTPTATATATATPIVTGTYGLSATVFLNPRWTETQTITQPVLYEIVLDVSGSTSYDFPGHGTIGGAIGVEQDTNGGADYQCETNNPSDPLPYTDTCTGGLDSPWRHYQERRIYAARQGLASFIDQMLPGDAMRIVAYSTSLSGTVESPLGWSGDKPTLKNIVRTIGAYNADPYRTTGYASGARALQKAGELLATAPPIAPNGQPYRRVMIFFSGSVPNVFLDGMLNTARDVCSNLTVGQALNTPVPCQVGVTSGGVERPITAMISQANNIKVANQNLSLYVIGMNNAPQIGLAPVASDPSMYFLATGPSSLDTALSTIRGQVSVVNLVCTPAGGNQWIDSVGAAHLPSTAAFPDLSDTVVGYTYIYEPGGGVPLYTVPIQRDISTDKISLLIPPPDADNPGIAPGIYEMAAYVGYKGNDSVSRMYDWFIDPNTLAGASRLSFALMPSDALGRVVVLSPLFLDLRPTVRICPPL